VSPAPRRALAAALALLCAVVLLLPGVVLVARDEFPLVLASRTLAPSLALLAVVFAVCGRLWLALAVTLPFALVWPIEIYHVLVYRLPVTAQVVGVIYETNLGEAGAFMAGLWPLLAGILAAVIALWTLAIVAAWRTRLAWRGRTRAWVIAAAALAVAGLAVRVAAEPDREAAETQVRDSYLPGRIAAYEPGFPLGVPLRIVDYLLSRERAETLRARLQSFTFGARQSAAGSEREIYVFVIGETGRRDRWQVNGYARPTSPRLAQLRNLVPIADMITPWTATRTSVPVMLTRKPAADKSFAYAEPSLITAFREAGFRTYWLTTQASTGRYDSPVAVFAGEADQRAYLNTATFGERGAYDEVVLAPLDQILARREPRQLIVVHTMGSHAPYGARYPDAFDRFLPSSRSIGDARLQAPELATEINNAYDNSILYTDFVLGEIVDRLRAQQAASAMLYVADHGESIFDDGCALVGHGSAAEREFQVAAFAWYSDDYARLNPARVAALRANAAKRTSTGNLFPSLLDMAGIRFPGETPQRSLFDAAFREGPRWVNGVGGVVDYDRARRSGACAIVAAGER
jgi:glucan phosphoethanolaminetransferase (alkaline phosphatase superfamily)